MKVTERLLVEIIQNDPKTAISSHSKRPKFTKKDSQNPITVSRVGPRWPTLDKKYHQRCPYPTAWGNIFQHHAFEAVKQYTD